MYTNTGCNSVNENFNIRKIQYSMIEVLAKISSILYFIIKIYTVKKMYLVEKKITGWIVLQYK